MLRPYQQEGVRSVVQHRKAGVVEQLVCLPTGTGKTALVAALPAALEIPAGFSTLFLCHSDEQANQALRSFNAANPNLRVGIEMGDRRVDPSTDVIIASRQTLERPERRAKFSPEHFRFVCLDEAHHALSRSVLATLQYVHCLKREANRDPLTLLLGITATPTRSDTRGLERVFSKIVFKKNIREMQKAGYLAELQAYRIQTPADISNVGSHNGEFTRGPLESAVNTPQRNALVVQKYFEYGNMLPFLGFSVDVQHALDLEATFLHHGIRCKAISGKTPIKERRKAIDDYARGELQGIISAAVFREGFDAPRATVALMAAPCQSSLVYTQEVGRVLRCYPSPEARETHAGYFKESAIVLDFCDYDASHRLFNAATLYGLNADFNMGGRRARAIIEEVEQMEMLNPSTDLRQFVSLDQIRASAQRVDVFSASGIAQVSRKLSRFAWLKQSENSFRLGIRNGDVLWVEVDQLGQATVYRKSRGTPNRIPVEEFDTPNEAFAYADSQVPADNIGIALSTARWRLKAPSETQAGLRWSLDSGLKQKFESAAAYHRHAVREYYKFGQKKKNNPFNRGAFSAQIDMAKAKKQEGRICAS